MIAEECLFVIGGENLVYHEWEEVGLVIHASENCVPPLSICEMRVSAFVGGDFLFPDGHELVSAVNAVTFSQSLKQNVVLDLQHCVDLQIEEHTDCLLLLPYHSLLLAPTHLSQLKEEDSVLKTDMDLLRLQSHYAIVF